MFRKESWWWKMGFKFSFLIILWLTQFFVQSNKFLLTEPQSVSNEFQTEQTPPLKDQNTHSIIWEELNPGIPRIDYQGVYFINADTGLALGEEGVIIKTKNGGQKWVVKETDSDTLLRAIEGFGGKTMIVCGDNGTILRSSDWGESWQNIQSGTTQNLWRIQFINNSVIWIVGEGAQALKSTDEGLTWINQPTPLPGYPFWDVSFLDTLFGYICTNSGKILRTTDGGLNWDVKQAGDNYGIFAIKAITRMKGVALGFPGKHVYTSDGGENWIFISQIVPTAEKIVFLDTLRGFAIGNGAVETTNGGLNWEYRTDIREGKYITFANDSVGYIVGKNLIIDKTMNAGVSWEKVVIDDHFVDVFFTNDLNGWFVGEKLYQTSDGGETLLPRNDFPGYNPSSVYFIDSLTGLVGTQDKIYKTYDGGISWEEKNITGVVGITLPYFRFFFINKHIGWALNNHYVIKTTDVGENWFAQLYTAGLKGIHFTDSLYGWLARGGGAANRPFKTTDGGESWIEQTNLTLDFTNDVFFRDRLNGFITRDQLYKTTDGGLFWSAVPGVLGGNFSNCIENNIFLVSVHTYNSTDAGKTWDEVLDIFNAGIYNLRLQEINIGYAIGSYGVIYRLSDSVVNIENESREKPDGFHLKQNYPNPFNPSTNITYSIKDGGLVSLKVFDILGNEITTLVNEILEPGEYTIKFNAATLPSGIYFYRITSGNFTATKKLLLLK